MLLCLDLATLTGFCHGAGDTGELPTIGSYRLPSTGDDLGRFLRTYRTWLTELLAGVEPELVVYESPVLHNSTSLITVRKLNGLCGVTELVVGDLNADYRRQGVAEIELAEVSPTSVKKALTGNGRAEKADMIAAARLYGLNPACSDEADAFGVWLYAVRKRFPAIAHHWDPLTQGRAA